LAIAFGLSTCTCVALAQPQTGAPQTQRDFIAAIEAARDLYSKGTNDLQRGSARPTRKRAICAMLKSPRVEGWIGKISQLTSNSDGWGVTSINIGSDIYVQTWNNALSDMMHKTLLDPVSQLFSAAAMLKKGDEVVFSGLFFGSDTDCVHEASMTLAGSIKKPEFIMRFTHLTKC
jgi:colicin import membrane protein